MSKEDLQALKATVSGFDRESIIKGFDNAISLYQQLRKNLFGGDIDLRKKTEEAALKFYEAIVKRN